MAENQEHKTDDPELERVRKSMGSRMDPDEPAKPEEKPEDKKPEAKPEEKKPESDDGKKDIKPGESDQGGKADDPEDKAPVNRGERYIPLKKWHDREDEHKTEVSTLQQKIKDLEAISTKQPGDQKDEDIEAFMKQTGFDRETVDGLLKLAEKRFMTPELRKAIETASTIAGEAELEAKFDGEFKTHGEPAIKTYLPNITDEQMAKAKPLLDRIAHTKEFHDKSLKYVVFENLEEIKAAIGESPAPEADQPKDKKTMEGSKPGAGKQPSFSAKDFAGKKDFSELNDMDPAVATALVKTFDNETYQNYYAWVKASDDGVEVMRDGKRIKLK